MASHVQYPYLFRVLRDNEDANNDGILAKDPTANKTIEEHVADGSSGYYTSQYISTSSSRNAVVNYAKKGYTYAPGNRSIAKINTEKLGEKVKYIDLTLPNVLNEKIPKNNKRARNFANSFKEVIIVGYIPASCIDDIYVV